MRRVQWFLTAACILALGLMFSRHAGLAQATNVLHYTPPAPVRAPIGGTIEIPVELSLQAGYHVNSNKPPDEFLIPLKLTWAKGVLEPVEVVFPKPIQYKIQSEPKPLSVYSGNFQLGAKFKVPLTAITGPAA